MLSVGTDCIDIQVTFAAEHCMALKSLPGYRRVRKAEGEEVCGRYSSSTEGLLQNNPVSIKKNIFLISSMLWLTIDCVHWDDI